MKLGEGSHRVFGRIRDLTSSTRARVAALAFVCERFHSVEKFARCGVNAPLAFMQSNERWKTVLQPPLRLLIREAREPAEVAPIGAGGITSEAARQLLRGLGAESAIGEYPSVV